MENAFFGGLREFSSIDVKGLEAAIKRLDVQIEQSSRGLQEEWSDLISAVEEIPVKTNAPKEPLNIEKTVEILNQPNLFKMYACFSEPMAVNCFLNNVVQALERNPGQEENIFQDFVQFASENGMMLPSPATSANPVSKSVASLHITINEEEETSSLLWERIRQLLKRGFLNKLEKISFTLKASENAQLLKKRVDLLQNLCILFQPDSVMKMYESLRRTQFQRLLSNREALNALFPDSFASEETQHEDAIELEKISNCLVVMIREDVIIIQEAGLFHCESILDYLHNAYLETFTDHLRTVLKQFVSLWKDIKVILPDRRGSFDSQRALSTAPVEDEDCICPVKHCFLSCLTVEGAVIKAVDEEKAIQKIVHVKATKSQSTSSHSSLQNLPPLPHSRALMADQGLPLPFGSGEPLQSIPSSPQLWQWREEFKGVSAKLSSCVVEVLKLVFSLVVEEEVKGYSNEGIYPTVQVTDDLVGGRMDYPRKVAKSCAALMKKAEKMLPLASIHGGKVFHVVRSSFVDTLSTVLRTYHSRLIQVSSDVPQQSPVQFMYIALSSATFIKNHLLFYEDVLGAEPRRPFPTLIRQYSELSEMLSKKVVDYHMDIIRNVLLHDIQSHNWTDHKPFFEDERCSFSLQMWNYYLQGIEHDLWSICPPKKSQEILLSLLYQSLSILTVRYGRVTPSYNRTGQVRADVLTILHIILSHLWSVTSSSSNILCSYPCDELFPELHSLCNSLLAALAIVGSPLKMLCDTLLSVYASSSDIVSLPNGAHWLSWIHPTVFSDQNMFSMTDSQTAFVLFSLLIHQPFINYTLLFQVLTARNAFLPITVMKFCDIDHLVWDTLLEPSEDYECERSSFLTCSFKTTEQEILKISDSEFIMNMYYILLHSCEENEALACFLIKLMDKEDSWSLFQTPSALRTAMDSKLAWFECIYSTLEPLIARVLQGVLFPVFEHDVKQTKGYNFTSLSALPCGCPAKKAHHTENKGKITILCHSLKDLISKLLADVIFVPSQIIKFFNYLQVKLHHQGCVATSHSAGLKILAAMMYRWLQEEANISSLSNNRISPATLKNISMFAELVWLVLTNQNESIRQNPNLPMEVDTFVNSQKDWIRAKIECIKIHLNKESDHDSGVESSVDCFNEVQADIRVGELLSKTKGKQALCGIYSYLMNNKESFLHYINPGFQLPLAEQTSRGSLVTPGQTFNPLVCARKLGDFSFDHMIIRESPLDWERLLDQYKGLDKLTIRNLVYHRFEFRKDEKLTDEEQTLAVQIEELFTKIKSD